jgi:peptidoglycan hydrolase-like protein with peptidoglycan-binding domain
LGIIPDAKAKPACDALSAKTASAPSTTSVTPFSVPLRLGARGAEVTRLQVFLNARDFAIAESGPGSRGNETDFFGVLTENAVKRFQAAYAAEILTPVGLTALSVALTLNVGLRPRFSPVVERGGGGASAVSTVAFQYH